jgi:plasmid stabilization system protein ParE
MKVEFFFAAAAEPLDAVAYYDEQRNGLGADFDNEVQAALQKNIQHTQAWPKNSNQTRRCRTNRFPYGLIYHVLDDGILVLAVMHDHRDPRTPIMNAARKAAK